jgi:hypothetical protein
MLIQLTPAIIVLTRRKFNFIIFVMLNQFIVFSVAKWNQLMNNSKSQVVSDASMLAIREMIYCSLLIIGSYYATRVLFIRRSPETHRFQMFTLSRRQYFWFGFYAFSQPLFAYMLPESLYVLHLLSSYAAIILIFCSKTDSEVFERWVKGSIIASGFYSFLKFGSLSTLGSLASLFFVISFIQWRWSNFMILVVLGFTGVAIQTVKADYRFINLESSLSTSQQISLLGNLLYLKFTNDKTAPVLLSQTGEESSELEPVEDPNVSESLAKGFARIGDDSLERVLTWTPSRVPFWEGETYSHIPYMFIPRVLWPGKPRRELWNKFGRVYGYLSANDETTSVGVNFLGEAYMNFGFGGLYAVACLFGSMVALMEALCYVFIPAHSYFCFLCFMLPFINYGLDLSSIINGVVLVLSVMFVVRYRLLDLIQRDVYT